VPDGGTGGTTHSTTEPLTKFVPVTETVTPGGLHAGVEAMDDAGDEDDKAVTVGPTIVKLICADICAPGFSS
jgi:hypothetical protein